MKFLIQMILIAGILLVYSSVVSPIRTLQRSSHVKANEGANGHRSRILKRSSSQLEIKCNQESLLSILDSCESAAKASVGALNSQRRKKRSSREQSFCGAGCSHMVINYAGICGLQEFIVNVSGACKLSGGEFKVNCIHAAVVVKPGIISCMNPHQESVSHEVSHLVDSTKNYRQSKCCSLHSYSNSSLPGHDIIFDRQTNSFRVDPPLLPPWKTMDVGEYPPIQDLTSSNLCVAEVTTTTAAIIETEAPDTIDLDITKKLLNSSGQLSNSAGSNTTWHPNTWLLCLFAALLLLTLTL